MKCYKNTCPDKFARIMKKVTPVALGTYFVRFFPPSEKTSSDVALSINEEIPHSKIEIHSQNGNFNCIIIFLVVI